MPDDRTPPERIAGNLALDLANTVSWRGSPREIDHIADAAGLRVWAHSVGLVSGRVSIGPGLLADVHRLRAAIYAAGGAIASGHAPRQSALGVVAVLAARTLADAGLSGAPANIDFSGDNRILGSLAWAALDLLRGDELGRLKQCPPDDCRWLFLDRTKNNTRRWCDMAHCGNRAKQQGRRARLNNRSFEP